MKLECHDCSEQIRERDRVFCNGCHEAAVEAAEDLDEAGPSEAALRDLFGFALRSLRARRFVAFLDELEDALPQDFCGFADDLLKWAGKTR